MRTSFGRAVASTGVVNTRVAQCAKLSRTDTFNACHGTRSSRGVQGSIAKGKRHSVADDGGTVLHSFAASDADVYDENGAGLDVVKQLTSEERGKNLIHVRNHLRETAMMCALKRGRIGACKLLLELHNDTGDNSGDEIVKEGEVLSRQQLDAVFN